MTEIIDLNEFRRRLKEQGVSDRRHAAFICPLCKIPQSIQSFIAIGCSEETAERQIGFSCIGRQAGAPAPRKEPDGQPCNWTLGGLLRLHELEVVDGEGKAHPYFEIATPEIAQQLEKSLKINA